MNEQERAIARTDLKEIFARMTELQAIPNWWKSLSMDRREKWERYMADVLSFLAAVT